MDSAGRNQTKVMELEKQDLGNFTNNFSSDNFICQAQYCNLYHGKIPEGWKGLEGGDVTVKVWVKTEQLHESTIFGSLSHSDCVEKFNLEIKFLTSHKATSCCYLPRLIRLAPDNGNQFMGVVYDLQSSNTLRHFLDKVEFTWLERIKVAVGLARLFKYLIHDEPGYLVCDFSAAHIMLDKDRNPVLFNYFLLVDGPRDLEGHCDRLKYGSRGYIDFAFISSGQVREHSFVFAYGVILCELLFKRKVDDLPINGWWCFLHEYVIKLYPLKFPRKVSFCEKVFPRKSGHEEVSFVEKSLEEDPYFKACDGLKISKLARLCVETRSETAPNMKGIVKFLEDLQIVRDNVEMAPALRH